MKTCPKCYSDDLEVGGKYNEHVICLACDHVFDNDEEYDLFDEADLQADEARINESFINSTI